MGSVETLWKENGEIFSSVPASTVSFPVVFLIKKVLNLNVQYFKHLFLHPLKVTCEMWTFYVVQPVDVGHVSIIQTRAHQLKSDISKADKEVLKYHLKWH